MFIMSCRRGSGAGRFGDRGCVRIVAWSSGVCGSLRISVAEPCLSNESKWFDFALVSKFELLVGSGMLNCCFKCSSGSSAEAGVTSGRLLGMGGDKGSARWPVVIAYSCCAASTGSGMVGAVAGLELCRLSFLRSAWMIFLRSCMNGATT